MSVIGRKTIGTVAYLGGVMSLPEPFVHSWQQLLEYNYEYLINPDERIEYTRATVSYHSFARNSLVDSMKGDWLLQLDTDITFDPDILGRMLNFLNNSELNGQPVDVMAGLYLYKGAPHPPVAYSWDAKKKAKTILGDWDDKGDLLQLRAAGAGCLLVHRRVFDRIRAELGVSPFTIHVDEDGSPLSEDHSFFEYCWKLKIPVYASPQIWVNHLTYKPLTEKDYDRKSQNISPDRIVSF